MAYSDFDQNTLEQKFRLQFVQTQTLLHPTPIPVSDYLRQTMQRHIPLATAINTEKARSELLIAPVLVELKTAYPQISLFSGNEFNVAPSQGLNGRCDFLLSRSMDQINIKAPVAVIIEAKREDLNAAIPQCAAAMLAAQQFNREHHQPIAAIYGSVTTGSVWRFLQLAGNQVTVDLNEVYLTPLETLFGCLVALLALDQLTPV